MSENERRKIQFELRKTDRTIIAHAERTAELIKSGIMAVNAKIQAHDEITTGKIEINLILGPDWIWRLKK